jgi:hypothetical protein
LNLNVFLASSRFTNILEVKKYLINHKKNGFVFYLPSMTKLDQNEEFDLFFFIKKSSTTKNYAFPISSTDYKKNLPMYVLTQLYRDYYETEEIPNEAFFQGLSIYKGVEWSWFYYKQYKECNHLQNG